MSNQHSATEADVGKLHKGINRALTSAVTAMNQRFDDAVESGDPVEQAMAFDPKLLTIGVKWVQSNNVTCAEDADDGKSDLSKQLAEVKRKQQAKVIDFKKENAV